MKRFISNDLQLEIRGGLPDALRVLLEKYPREAWKTHRNFSGLAGFWLDRHIMFRKTISKLVEDSEGYLDNPGDQFVPNLFRLTTFFVDQLHTHHIIEDEHLFPVLERFDKRLLRGFNLLDADHKALDENISLLAEKTNAILSIDTTPRDAKRAVNELREVQLRFDRFLDRHLSDEEELVIPVILEFAVSDSHFYGS